MHGISIREKKTGKLVEFIECAVGRSALMVLSGVRRNLGKGYVATEDIIKEEEFAALKSEKAIA